MFFKHKKSPNPKVKWCTKITKFHVMTGLLSHWRHPGPWNSWAMCV